MSGRSSSQMAYGLVRQPVALHVFWPNLSAGCGPREDERGRRLLLRAIGSVAAEASLVAVGIGWMVLLSRSAAATAAPDKPKASDDPKLFSLYASQYLAETQTAAYLWAKNNPEKARRLLADKEYLAMLPAPPASAINGMPDEKEWLQQLRDQANAARSCVPAAMEWLLVPPGTGCA